jgi:hypothetical protein
MKKNTSYWGQARLRACAVGSRLVLLSLLCVQATGSVAGTAGPVVAWAFGDDAPRNIPTNLTDVIAIGAGYSHCLALQRNGTVVAWGTNDHGQCSVPSNLTGVISIAAGSLHSLALRADGTVVAWGAGASNTGAWPDVGQCIVPLGLTSVVAITAGWAHSLALQEDGTVVAWGAGTTDTGIWPESGQCIVPAQLRNVVAIAGGAAHSMALRADGSVVTWAFNESFIIDWPEVWRLRPTGLASVVGIAAGAAHNLAIRSDQSVGAWGNNSFGQADVPSGLTGVVAVAGGSEHSLALRADGTVLDWGQYWDGTRLPRHAPAGLSNVVAIASRGDFSLALVGSGAPVLLERPLSRLVRPGDSALFRVVASGAWPLSCQWRLNGTALPGATNRWLFLKNVREANVGTYTVTVTNPHGSITSSEALLTVDGAAPTVSVTSHADQQVVTTSSIVLAGTATDAGTGDHGVESVEVNGVPATMDTTSGAATASWRKVLSLKLGTNTIQVLATDTLGNSTSNFIRIISDTMRPTVTVSSPKGNQRISNAVFSAQGTAADNMGVGAVWYRVGGKQWSQASGTTAWAAPLVLTPGTNLLQFYAEDVTHHQSTITDVKCIYVTSDRLVVKSIGKGSIARNYNNALLEVGQSYSMTATPATGNRFDRWILTQNGVDGPAITNKTLTFRMQTNLAVTAIFLDGSRPTLTVSSPKPNQRFSNAVFSARGTAKDNLGVSNVWYRLNDREWSKAAGTAAWTASGTFLPGTNLLQFYAEDAARNQSAITKLKCVYVVTARLQVRTLGQGSLSQKYSNALLEVGKGYTLTVTPTNGHKFDRWIVTDQGIDRPAVTTKTLTFVMTSNLALTAVLLDTNRPAVTVSNLAASQNISNDVFAVRGSAKDNVSVSAVWCRLNNGAWNLASGTKIWTNLLLLMPGTNRFEVYAEDAAGNRSASTSLKVNCTAPNFSPTVGSLVLHTDRNGPIETNLAVLGHDPDGNRLTLLSVANRGPGGIGVTATKVGDQTVRFSPLDTFLGTNWFDYSLSDGRGGTASGQVTVIVWPVTLAPGARTAAGFRLRLSGSPGRAYQVERAPAVSGPWNVIAPDLILPSAGFSEVLDTNAPSNQGFYRARSRP